MEQGPPISRQEQFVAESRRKKPGQGLGIGPKNKLLMAIYTSPLIRALDTERLIKFFHPSTPIFEEKGLIEMDLSGFDGTKVQDWALQYPDIRKAWNENPAFVKMPDGESLKEVRARVKEALELITRIYPPDTKMLISSHNFVNLTIFN